MSGVRFPPGFRLERLARAHRRSPFESGEPAVDAWLRTKALQNQEKHLSTTRVLFDDAGEIAGYYTLATGQVDFGDLPVEQGTVCVGAGSLRLFQRANGAAARGLVPVNATIDVRWPEARADPGTTVRYGLGGIGGVPLSFTDAAPGPPGHLLYLASAEDSPDAVRDGPVAGSAVGVIAPDGSARHALLMDPAGRPLPFKLEGIALDPRRRDRAYVVADPDDPARPAILLTVALTGPWWD